MEAQNGQKIWASGAFLLHTEKSSSGELVNQVLSEFSGKFVKKIDENLYIDIIWPYMGPKKAQKFNPQALHNNQVSLSHIKNFFEKMSNTSKIPNFCLFYVIKNPTEIEAESQNSNSKSFFGDIDIHIEAKYRKDQMKTEGAYSIWKKGWHQTDRWTTDALALEKLYWLCQQ